MSRIRGSGNQRTELALIRFFKANDITGWRRHQIVFGKPDFVFHRARVCVFVDGCFWHICPTCYRKPESNQEYWYDKANKNKARDRQVN